MSTVSIDQIRALRGRDLNQLSLLLALLRNCSVSETARQLGLAQPAVSRSLERLRSDFHDRLLVRQGNEMIRTTRGDVLLPQLEQLFTDLNARVFAEEPAQPSTACRTLTIACNDYLQSLLAPSLHRHFMRVAPHVTLRFTAPGHTRYGAIIDSGLADFVIGGECSVGELRSEHLFDEQFVAVVDSNHEAVSEELTFHQFCTLSHVDHSPTGTYAIPTLLDRRTAELGGKREVTTVVTSAAAILEILKDTEMVSIWYSNVARVMSRQHQCEAVKVVPLAFDFINASVVLCWGNQSHEDTFLAWARRQIVMKAQTLWSEPRGDSLARERANP